MRNGQLVRVKRTSGAVEAGWHIAVISGDVALVATVWAGKSMTKRVLVEDLAAWQELPLTASEPEMPHHWRESLNEWLAEATA